MKCLLVEDDSETAAYIENGLTQAGHVVDVVTDGHDAAIHGIRPCYNLMIVDRMLPGRDGVAVVKELRAAGVVTPVMFLTALGGIDDRVEGLEAGGDDYLVKPFALAELLARVNALARRSPGQKNDCLLQVADLELDRLKRCVRRGGQRIDLQPREFTLLEYLMQNAGKLVTKTMLLEAVWNFHFDPRTNIVETHISRLRTKIDKEFDRTLIHTVRGSGYMLSDTD